MATASSPTTPARDLGFFERYLTLWVLLCIAAGIGLGKLAPGLAAA
jgi:ACR3 family arsenite transporter